MQAEMRKVIVWAVAGGFILGVHTCLLFQGINPIWVYFNMLLGMFAVYVAVLIARDNKSVETKEEVVKKADESRDSINE